MTSIDFYFLNSLAQFIVLIVLLVIMIALRGGVEQRALLVGVWMLALTVLLRRMNEIAEYFGLNIFSQLALTALSWVVIFILYYAFIQIWRHRVLLRHIANMLKTDKRYSEVLKQNGDKLQEERGA